MFFGAAHGNVARSRRGRPCTAPTASGYETEGPLDGRSPTLARGAWLATVVLTLA
jgi:hypothetical protein